MWAFAVIVGNQGGAYMRQVPEHGVIEQVIAHQTTYGDVNRLAKLTLISVQNCTPKHREGEGVSGKGLTDINILSAL
jgi:hypothetical protein